MISESDVKGEHLSTYKVFVEAFDFKHVWRHAPKMVIEKDGALYASIEFESQTNFSVQGLGETYRGRYGKRHSTAETPTWSLDLMEANSDTKVVEALEAEKTFVNVIGLEICQWEVENSYSKVSDGRGDVIGRRKMIDSESSVKMKELCSIQVDSSIPQPVHDRFLMALVFLGKHLPWYSVFKGV